MNDGRGGAFVSARPRRIRIPSAWSGAKPCQCAVRCYQSLCCRVAGAARASAASAHSARGAHCSRHSPRHTCSTQGARRTGCSTHRVLDTQGACIDDCVRDRRAAVVRRLQSPLGSELLGTCRRRSVLEEIHKARSNVGDCRRGARVQRRARLHAPATETRLAMRSSPVHGASNMLSASAAAVIEQP
jgi:hypothetical protein